MENKLIAKICETLLFDFGEITKEDIMKNGAKAFHEKDVGKPKQKTYKLLRLNDKGNLSGKRTAEQAFNDEDEQKENKISEGEILFLQKKAQVSSGQVTKKRKLQ